MRYSSFKFLQPEIHRSKGVDMGKSKVLRVLRYIVGVQGKPSKLTFFKNETFEILGPYLSPP